VSNDEVRHRVRWDLHRQLYRSGEHFTG
jgi:hypothetical protein